MLAELSILAGPLPKTTLSLAYPVSIGRESSNSICLEDESVSGRHCVFEWDNGHPVVVDLNSASGTFVNGIPVLRRTLSPGDEIAVGNSVLLFHAERREGVASHRVELDEDESDHPAAEELEQEEIELLNPAALAALPESDRVARRLTTLLRIATSLGSLQDLDALQWQLLGVLFDVIPAERGAIFLVEPGSTELASHIAWDRQSGPDHPVHVSLSILRRVIEERVSLSEAASAASPHTFLCVPLVASGRALGAIYLDSSNAEAGFGREDLRLLSAIAGLAGVAMENARQFERLGAENRQLRAEISLRHDMVGRHPRMLEIYRFIERVAPSDATVLIHGESGTGKELAARAIHMNSPRKEQPFVALNCAALTETLLESELFGHEKGAFTNAIAQKKGLMEVAENGTLFLDEIGELSPILQAKLLRVLQEREFVRVGGTRPIRVNVRFLAATNRDLREAAREEKFRPDLFHRLNVISLTLPALREHPEDIPLLAEHFVARFAKKCSRTIRGLSAEARACLLQYEWPGNVRELENAMERAVVVGSSEWILPEDLPETLLELATPEASEEQAKYHDAVRAAKKQLILGALDQTNGNITEAAKALGVHPNYLHRLIRNLDLRMAKRKQSPA